MVKVGMEKGERSKTNPLLAGAAFLGALLSPFESLAQQTSQPSRGRPATRADMVAIVGEAEMRRQEEYNRRAQEEYNRRLRSDPAFREAERRKAQQIREDEIYCAGIRRRIEIEGLRAVAEDIGGEQATDC